MPFTLNAYLPSLKQEIPVKELYYKQYRDLVKSLYNVNKKDTIQQYNSILLDLCPDIKDKDITFEDKLSLLLTIRNFCVSPDLKLKGTDSNNNTFNYTASVDSLIQAIRTVEKSFTLEINNVIVNASSYKMRDEYVFLGNNKDITVILASNIDNIKIDNVMVEFKDLSLNERIKIVSSLPYSISDRIYQAILDLEDYYQNQDFLNVVNPINNEVALKISKNITFETLQKMVEFLFTEDLGNIYRAFYNIVTYAKFSPEYVDTITPVEMQVYWMYFMQDQSEKEANRSETQPGAALPTGVPNSELGF